MSFGGLVVENGSFVVTGSVLINGSLSLGSFLCWSATAVIASVSSRIEKAGIVSLDAGPGSVLIVDQNSSVTIQNGCLQLGGVLQLVYTTPQPDGTLVFGGHTVRQLTHS
jgi:hypothetical protein